ncbi:class I SAM-dependent methyltransferase [Phycicoccus avicenniae]|uniref:class I SAM-dependent methyltransferase n=1 Tax=Phycicoccus avicenniae TaxID=2828860 RepID=UPI003D2E824C
MTLDGGTPGNAWAAFERVHDARADLVVLLAGFRAGLLSAVVGAAGTAEELAARAGTDPRLTAEWCRAMTVAGFLDVDATGHRFAALPGLDEVLEVAGVDSPVDIESALLDRTPAVVAALAAALRDGEGADPAVYGDGWARLQDAAALASDPGAVVTALLAPVAGVVEALEAGCRVIEVGCGGGWALEVLAERYPEASFVGLEIDPVALGIARGRLARFGDRCVVGPEAPAGERPDVVLLVDVLHDLPRPAADLARLLADAAPGAVLVVAEADATGDFSLDRTSGAAWQYASGFTRCLPLVRRAGGEGAGPLWGRTAVLRTLADAGVHEVAVHTTADGHAVFAARV